MLHIEKNYSMYHGKGKEEICYNDSIKEKSPTQSGLGAHNRSALGLCGPGSGTATAIGPIVKLTAFAVNDFDVGINKSFLIVSWFSIIIPNVKLSLVSCHYRRVLVLPLRSSLYLRRCLVKLSKMYPGTPYISRHSHHL